MTITLQQKKDSLTQSILALKQELEKMDCKLSEIDNLESEIENFKILLSTLDPELKQIALSELGIVDDKTVINIFDSDQSEFKDQQEQTKNISKFSQEEENEALEILTPPDPLEKLAQLKQEASHPPAPKPEIVFDMGKIAGPPPLEIFLEERGKLRVTITNNSCLEIKAKLKKDAQVVVDTVEIFVSLGTIQDLTKDGTEPLKYQGIYEISDIEIFDSKREGILKSISQGLTSDVVVNPMGLMSDDPDLFFDEDASLKQPDTEPKIVTTDEPVTENLNKAEEDDIYEKIRAELFSSDADELDFDLEGFVKLHDHLTKNLSFSETLECYKKLGHSSVATFGLLSECRKLIKVLDDRLITKPKTYDFMAVMKEIDQEIKRLNWGADQAKKYLIDNYGKVSRQLLSDNQLLNLLTDLKNQ